MQVPRRKRRVILDAVIDHSVIRGTLTAPTGERRDFHGWLELSTALETILDPGANAVRDSPGYEPRHDQSAI